MADVSGRRWGAARQDGGGAAREGCTASAEGDGAEEGGAQRDRWEAAAAYVGAASGKEGRRPGWRAAAATEDTSG